MLIAGADGCRGRWVVAAAPLDALDETKIAIVSDLAALLDGPEAPDVLAIDMPIGLPETIVGPGRVAEQAVRPLLGARQSSVFSIPARAAVEAPDYASACAAALATSDPPRKISRQGFMLFPKVREIDAILRARPALAARVFEVHPELAFRRMSGAPLAEPKKVRGKAHPPGLALRRALLVAEGLPEAIVSRPPPRGAGEDDVVDALACLATAARLARGQARPYPDPPGRDAFGLPIAIWA